MNALAVKEPVTFAPDDESFEAIVNDLSDNVVKHFFNTGLPESELIEFVYGLDAIEELSKMPGFPKDRMLTTRDLIKGGWDVIWPFINKAKVEGIVSNYGVAVNENLLQEIEDFFEAGYLTAIYNMVKSDEQQKLMFVLNGTALCVGISQSSAHPEYGVLQYTDMTNHFSVQMPFCLDRILGA